MGGVLALSPRGCWPSSPRAPVPARRRGGRAEPSTPTRPPPHGHPHPHPHPHPHRHPHPHPHPHPPPRCAPWRRRCPSSRRCGGRPWWWRSRSGGTPAGPSQRPCPWPRGQSLGAGRQEAWGRAGAGVQMQQCARVSSAPPARPPGAPTCCMASPARCCASSIDCFAPWAVSLADSAAWGRGEGVQGAVVRRKSGAERAGQRAARRGKPQKGATQEGPQQGGGIPGWSCPSRPRTSGGAAGRSESPSRGCCTTGGALEARARAARAQGDLPGDPPCWRRS
jgi:hypothetical protein